MTVLSYYAVGVIVERCCRQRNGIMNLVGEEDGTVNDSDNLKNISLICSSIYILIVIAKSIWHINNFPLT